MDIPIAKTIQYISLDVRNNAYLSHIQQRFTKTYALKNSPHFSTLATFCHYFEIWATIAAILLFLEKITQILHSS